jgi:hypothetical protein
MFAIFIGRTDDEEPKFGEVCHVYSIIKDNTIWIKDYDGCFSYPYDGLEEVLKDWKFL